MIQKLLLIINPVTAKATISPYLVDIIDLFEKNKYNVTVHVTKKKNDTYEVIKKTGSRFDVVVSVGGDGTLNETVAAVSELEMKPKIGYLPAGTTNDFALSWGIPKNPLEAARAIVTKEPIQADVNIFSGRPYIYVAAFGAFTEVSYSTPQEMKQSLGRTAYIFEGIKSLPTIRPWKMKVEFDGRRVEGEFLYGMVSNTKSVGGFELKVKDEISISDGYMEVILIRKPQNPVDNHKLLGAVIAQDVTSEYIVYAHVKSFKFESEEAVPWTIDGENGGMLKSGEITLKPREVEMFL